MFVYVRVINILKIGYKMRTKSTFQNVNNDIKIFAYSLNETNY